jgi:hypothetical protein
LEEYYQAMRANQRALTARIEVKEIDVFMFDFGPNFTPIFRGLLTAEKPEIQAGGMYADP